MSTAGALAQTALVALVAILFAALTLDLAADTVRGFELPDTTPPADTQEFDR